MSGPRESKKVYEDKQFDVVVEEWGGRKREIVDHPGSTTIVAIDRAGYVALVRQLREPARKRLLELPAGTLEEGEEPLAGAQRELEEIPQHLPELEDAKTLVGLLLFLRTRP